MEEKNEQIENEVIINPQSQDAEPDYKDLYYRASADYANLKRNTEKAQEKTTFIAVKSSVINFLPILDDLLRGAETGDEAMLAIYRKMVMTLAEMKVILFPTAEDKFNIDYCNAVGVENDQTKENDDILKVVKYGAKFGDEIIRYADVIVNKKD